MNFNSPSFFVFFLIVIGLYSLRISWTVRKFQLLIFSYVFYAAWRPEFVLLIWISTIVDWQASKKIYAAENNSTRRIWLAFSLATNFGFLVYFKYAQFLFDNTLQLLGRFGINFEPVDWGITLPVGISFYTFQTLSYTIDIYRRNSKPCDSFLDYALYVTFFPQLVAGPIVRSRDFLPQCKEPKRASSIQLSWGITLIIIGLFEKLVVSDGLLAPRADAAFRSVDKIQFIDAWFGSFAFAGQVFCDFAGYSTTAIGVALCLGFSFQDNFRFPYAAIGFSDFWQRWHISLSSWLRDYLYIPLGGNRKGAVMTYVNLMITMLLGGLWHGANWTFVAWGGLHGSYLIVERLLTRALGHLRIWQWKVSRISLALITFLLTCVTWVFFRAQDFVFANSFVQTMFFLRPGSTHRLFKATELILIGGVMGVMLTIHWLLRDSSVEEAAERLPWWLRGIVLAAMIVAMVTMSGDDRAFIYFQF